MNAKQIWTYTYKGLAIALILYVLIAGMLVQMPKNDIWGQTSRNLFYHVPMWFAMLAMMFISVFHSIRLLRELDPDRERTMNPLLLDIRAVEAAKVGVMFNILGLATGILWSRVTWNENIATNQFAAWWNWDPIQVSALVALLIYGAYFLLRSSFSEPEQRGKVAAVYNIFAAATLIPLFFIVPKLLEGLHPTSGGKGSFVVRGEGMTNDARLIFYPAILGFTFLGLWLFNLRYRAEQLKLKLEDWLAEKQYQKETQ
ncbi:MAG: cytochrome c biogenesis protein CcsA [Bacteroidota bacterium]